MERYEKMQLQGFVWIVASYFMKHAEKLSDNTDERVLKVCQYLKENISEKVALDELANVACVTKSHLGRLFRSAFDMSPIQYAIRCKIQYAQGLLLTTDMSVKSVSEKIGIDDVSYFIRIFKKIIGFTPLDYRERLKY
jgi:transcriptional regulator GlxA family with amidase domain